MVRKFAGRCGAITAVSIFLASCGSQPAATVQQGTTGMVSYVQAKRQMATELERALIGAQSNKYRLVAVAGPAYPIGAVLDPTNPVDLLTRKCLLSGNSIPNSEPWSTFPTWTSKSDIDLAASLPVSVNSALVTAGLSGSVKRASTFQLAELTQQLVPHAELLSRLSEEQCQLDLAKADVLVVRGVVAGREILSSISGNLASASLKAIKIDSMELKYDASKNFELKDEKVVPKFMIVTFIPAASRKATLEEAMTAPPESVIQRIESRMTAAR